jgi:hypothetical protein
MRLSESEISIIKSVACQVCGNQTHIYLFGSRTDDSKRGGDIDLFINLEAGQEPKKIMLQKAEFLGKLDILLGEQPQLERICSWSGQRHRSQCASPSQPLPPRLSVIPKRHFLKKTIPKIFP